MVSSTTPALAQHGWPRTWRQMIAASGASLMMLPLVLSAEPAEGADLSLRCIYDVMTGTHEAMLLCGEQLDDRDQAKYMDLTEALKKYINENARSDVQKVGPNHNEKLRQHREMRVQQGFCKQPDYAWFKERLVNILRTQEGENIRKRLESPGNPFEGGCF